jgi:hypothetical protein
MNMLQLSPSNSLVIPQACRPLLCAAALCLALSQAAGRDDAGVRLGVETAGTGTSLQVRVTGQAGQRLVLEATADFAQWSPVFTNEMAGVPFTFTVPQPGVYPWRFYRGVLRPTSLVLVRRDATGGVVLRYVAGEALFADGTPPWIDEAVALPAQIQSDPGQASTPSAVLFPATDRLYAARAIVDPVGNQTTIHVVDSGYPTMLAESTARVAVQRPGIIGSGVVLTYYTNQLVLVWREGDTLYATRSSDGLAWSAVTPLISLTTGVFAVWSEGDRFYLAHAPAGGTSIQVRVSTDGSTFSAPTIWDAGVGPINGISVSTDAQHVFVAFSTLKSVRVARMNKGGGFDTVQEVFAAPPLDPDYNIFAVTMHPSPFTWALQYVASSRSGGGLIYTTFGRRSPDGLNFTPTTWIYATNAVYRGPTAMALTPVPMPWLVQTHNSGRTTNVYTFVITGDGYTYGERQTFLDAARAMTANITNRAPFCYNRDLFNVWAMITFSKSSGFDSSAAVDDHDTIFDSYRSSGSMVVPRQDGIRHARRLITSNPTAPDAYGWMFQNAPGGATPILPWDTMGVPMPHQRANSLASVHEFFHTSVGGFRLGDHERHNQPFQNVNKSFDPTLTPGGTHAWQPWFVFAGPAPSRLMAVTDAYRDGLQAWIDGGNSYYNYWPTHFAYSENPASANYVDALALLNVGLWESELSDVPNLNTNRQYAPLRACAMYSQIHHAQGLCPVCAQIMVEHLQTAAGIVDPGAGRPFDWAAYQHAGGAFLEFQYQNGPVCGELVTPLPLNLNGLLTVNGIPVPSTSIFTYSSEDYYLFGLARVDLTPFVTSGTLATVVFNQQSVEAGETHLWLPGMHVVNGKGARYPVQPNGAALVDRLHQKHAPQCDYEYWDLAEADFRIVFTPN